MKKPNQIMEASLPVPEAADLTARAAQHGVPTSEYLGFLVMSGAYGANHPEVKEFRERPKLGVFGPKTQEEEK